VNVPDRVSSPVSVMSLLLRIPMFSSAVERVSLMSSQLHSGIFWAETLRATFFWTNFISDRGRSMTCIFLCLGAKAMSLLTEME